MNLAIHLLNVWLLFLLINRMTGAVWRAALVAALFALQPVTRLGLAGGPGRVPRQALLGLRDQRFDLGQGALAIGWR